ncbi:MAG: NADH:flavin oxidoreductase [Bacteroidota bacterium]|nr:NADH:flavin oxidoreductase [Bacteroidota bacterium]
MYFTYKSLEELEYDIAERNLAIAFEERLEAVRKPVQIGGVTLGNRLGIHPMEGCDAEPDGSPGELTFRRWRRFGGGGAKLIWGEATAVCPEGRANPRQLWIHKGTVRAFRQLVDETRRAHRETFGDDHDLLVGLQLTHSGRFSWQRPILAMHAPTLDARTLRGDGTGATVGPDWPTAGDEYLQRLEERFVEAAVLAAEAGFDFVDIKQCHGYLAAELLASRRRKGPYGGSFENRTRFIRNILEGIRSAAGNRLLLASRVSVYDGIPFVAHPVTAVGIPVPVPLPYVDGFGTDPDNPLHEDLDEPLRLVEILVRSGVRLVNVTLGCPYWNPHIGRPYERPSEGGYLSPEHPLVGVDRHFRLTAAVQRHFPELAVVGTGYSWLRQWCIHAAEGNIRRGRVTIAALGRGAIAYPDFARDALGNGKLRSDRVCLTVGFCTDLMRRKDHPLGQSPTGCVPRDPYYADIYRGKAPRKGTHGP